MIVCVPECVCGEGVHHAHSRDLRTQGQRVPPMMLFMFGIENGCVLCVNMPLHVRMHVWKMCSFMLIEEIVELWGSDCHT